MNAQTTTEKNLRPKQTLYLTEAEKNFRKDSPNKGNIRSFLGVIALMVLAGVVLL